MPAKLSEKHGLMGLICLATGILLLINTSVLASPVRISEKGLFLSVLSCALILCGMYFFKRTVSKV